jgi:glycosyltransferase involved in cell wall biosynthesis
MKIRILIDAKILGGVEKHAITLCAGLSARQHDCKLLFVRSYLHNPLYQVCEHYGVAYQVFVTYFNLVRNLILDKPDILHTHGYKANLLGRLLGLILKTKIITTFHAGEKPVGRVKVYDLLDRWSAFLSANIAVNDIIAANVHGPVTIIPNFVEVPSQPNKLKTSAPFHVYFIGRFSHEKDPICFCKLSQLPSHGVVWHMVGSGPLLATCKQQYPENIYFHGAIIDIDKIWPQVDLLCITSRAEGLPLVLLEAMSRGIPVVAFDVGSIQVVAKDLAYVVTPDDLIAMQACIEQHFNKTIADREILSQQERAKVRLMFSSEAVIPMIESFYQQCMHS